MATASDDLEKREDDEEKPSGAAAKTMTPGHQESHEQRREEGNQLQYGNAMAIVDGHCCDVKMKFLFTVASFLLQSAY